MEFLNSIFLPMLAGHLIADFWLQPGSWVLQKKQNGLKSTKMFLHCAIAAILPVVFTFQLNLWWFIPIIFATHILIDFFKSKIKDNIPAFLADQLLHIAVLWVLAIYGTRTGISSGAATFWLYATGFILITSPLGILTGKMLGVILPEKEKSFTNGYFRLDWNYGTNPDSDFYYHRPVFSYRFFNCGQIGIPV